MAFPYLGRARTASCMTAVVPLAAVNRNADMPRRGVPLGVAVIILGSKRSGSWPGSPAGRSAMTCSGSPGVFAAAARSSRASNWSMVKRPAARCSRARVGGYYHLAFTLKISVHAAAGTWFLRSRDDRLYGSGRWAWCGQACIKGVSGPGR